MHDQGQVCGEVREWMTKLSPEGLDLCKEVIEAGNFVRDFIATTQSSLKSFVDEQQEKTEQRRRMLWDEMAEIFGNSSQNHHPYSVVCELIQQKLKELCELNTGSETLIEEKQKSLSEGIEKSKVRFESSMEQLHQHCKSVGY